MEAIHHHGVYYQMGADFAERVQKGIREGKTFFELIALEPATALRYLETIPIEHSLSPLDSFLKEWYEGYLSRWD